MELRIIERELRIGNLIRDNRSNKDIIVTGQLIADMEEWAGGVMMSNPPKPFFEPIPLTEDWLLKFGFELYGDGSGGSIVLYGDPGYQTDLQIGLTESNSFFGELHNVVEGPKVKHVHQLQNLYFALASEELEIFNPTDFKADYKLGEHKE